FSNSRASILSSTLAMAVLCLSLKKNRLMIQGIAVTVCVICLFAIAAPSRLDMFMSESQDSLIYKGHRDEGVLGSRQEPWRQTMRSVQQHPWWGTGFGTSAVGPDPSERGKFFSNQDIL